MLAPAVKAILFRCFYFLIEVKERARAPAENEDKVKHLRSEGFKKVLNEG